MGFTATVSAPLGGPIEGPQPRILILLATYNGLPYLPVQLETLFGQLDVDVTVLASDDGSTDGTAELLADHPGIQLLPPVDEAARSAARNFFRLIRAVDDTLLDAHDYVGLADQDDLWNLGKLRFQVARLRELDADAVSSNVTAFDETGKHWLIKKDYPQRALDHLLESGGPGCSFLMTPRLVRLIRSQLADPVGPAWSMPAHDWLFYGIGRSAGWRWHIGAEPTIEYRQHSANVLGANTGLRSKVTRLAMIRQDWHRNGALLMSTVGLAVAAETGGDTVFLARAYRALQSRKLADRWRLARLAGQLRRRPLHRVAVFVLILLGVW